MADYHGFRAAELGSIMGDLRDAIAVRGIGAQVQENYRRGLGQIQMLLDEGSPVLPVVNLHEHPEVRQVAGLDVDILERLAFRERQHGRSILNPDYFVASRVSFKQWPQVPGGSVGSNCANPRMYELVLMGRTISIPVRYLKDERIRRVDTADEARDYQRLYSEILDVLTEHLRLPPSMVDNIRGHCLATHNMLKSVSRSTVYRRWADSGMPPTLHDVLAMYIVGLGRLHKSFVRSLSNHGGTWMMWVGRMRPILTGRLGGSGIQDAPVRWDGKISPVVPYRPAIEQSVISMQLIYYDTYGSWYKAPRGQVETINAIQDAMETVMDMQRQQGMPVNHAQGQEQVNAQQAMRDNQGHGRVHAPDQHDALRAQYEQAAQQLRQAADRLTLIVRRLDDHYGEYKVTLAITILVAIAAMLLYRLGAVQAGWSYTVRGSLELFDHAMASGRSAVQHSKAYIARGFANLMLRAGYMPMPQRPVRAPRGMTGRMFGAR